MHVHIVIKYATADVNEHPAYDAAIMFIMAMIKWIKCSARYILMQMVAKRLLLLLMKTPSQRDILLLSKHRNHVVTRGHAHQVPGIHFRQHLAAKAI
jgi:hypothetical protein